MAYLPPDISGLEAPGKFVNSLAERWKEITVLTDPWRVLRGEE
jgi:hypothetical protein